MPTKRAQLLRINLLRIFSSKLYFTLLVHSQKLFALALEEGSTCERGETVAALSCAVQNVLFSVGNKLRVKCLDLLRPPSSRQNCAQNSRVPRSCSFNWINARLTSKFKITFFYLMMFK